MKAARLPSRRASGGWYTFENQSVAVNTGDSARYRSRRVSIGAVQGRVQQAGKIVARRIQMQLAQAQICRRHQRIAA